MLSKLGRYRVNEVSPGSSAWIERLPSKQKNQVSSAPSPFLETKRAAGRRFKSCPGHSALLNEERPRCQNKVLHREAEVGF